MYTTAHLTILQNNRKDRWGGGVGDERHSNKKGMVVQEYDGSSLLAEEISKKYCILYTSCCFS